MASKAVPGRILVARCRVAGNALCQRVPSGQRKSCLSVVKIWHLPGLVGMALHAGQSKLALMLVVFSVASQAFEGCTSERDKIFVAGQAFHGWQRVCIAQGESGF